MNGYTDDPLISTLFNQPALVWSLGISAAIFIIAIGLASVLKLRNHYKRRQSEKPAADIAAKDALSGSKGIIKNAEELANLSRPGINGQSATEDNTLVSGASGERTLKTAVSGNEADDPAHIVEVTKTDAEKEKAESEEPNRSKSALANIFEDEIIVDPHLQAMRENLPEIDMFMLQKGAQLVNSQLLERHDRVTRNLEDELW